MNTGQTVPVAFQRSLHVLRDFIRYWNSSWHTGIAGRATSHGKFGIWIETKRILLTSPQVNLLPVPMSAVLGGILVWMGTFPLQARDTWTGLIAPKFRARLVSLEWTPCCI
eukprot:gnl/TRDRNA2_/TRDRNA2_127484_c0_seq1.p2 gnl/TRDRNA2_/TRDRNA2_127484_c0~~gnl/TRDRNA2_/TRDRNA2_127484_c0_seq1.p2  ORF type:complete len:111 (-),score=3.82 gnl/TRDRNA2_/TRDRNA2_127484_c0_seq1:20-352(-)